MKEWNNFLLSLSVLSAGFLGFLGFVGFLIFLTWLIFWTIFFRLLPLRPLLKLLPNLEDPVSKARLFQRLRDDDKMISLILRGLEPNLALSFGERERVIELAGQLRLKEATQPLVKLLKELPMWEGIHAKAIWALGEIGDESIAPELVPYIGEFNYLSVRMAAIETLHKLGWGDFVDAFNRLMVGNEEALTVLREKYRHHTIRALVRALWASRPAIAIAAAKALGKLNAVEALKELKRRCSPLQSPKEVRQVCQDVVTKLEQISRLPSPARSEIDTSTLPRPATPSSFQTDTLPSPANPDETQQ